MTVRPTTRMMIERRRSPSSYVTVTRSWIDAFSDRMVFEPSTTSPRQGGISPVGDLGEAVTSDRPERQRCDVVTVDLERGKDGVCRHGRGGSAASFSTVRCAVSPVARTSQRQPCRAGVTTRCDRLVANMMAAATAATTTVIVASAARTGTPSRPRRESSAIPTPTTADTGAPTVATARPSRETFPLDTRVLLSGRAEAETAARQGRERGPCHAGRDDCQRGRSRISQYRDAIRAQARHDARNRPGTSTTPQLP